MVVTQIHDPSSLVPLVYDPITDRVGEHGGAEVFKVSRDRFNLPLEVVPPNFRIQCSFVAHGEDRSLKKGTRSLNLHSCALKIIKLLGSRRGRGYS